MIRGPDILVLTKPSSNCKDFFSLQHNHFSKGVNNFEIEHKTCKFLVWCVIPISECC